MSEFPVGRPNVTSVPAADVTAPPSNAGSVIFQAFPLRQAEEDANEIFVRVRGSNLRRMRRRLQSLASGTSFPWAEVLLGVSMLCVGGILGALASDIPWATVSDGKATVYFKAVLFYVVLPILGGATAVAYLFLRHYSAKNAALIAETLLEDLPDPERAL